jgi:predicted metal-dependent TIM-barrel fold hydrolase
MKIGIVGARKRNDDKDFNELLESLNDLLVKRKLTIGDITLVSGGCPKGGDKFAEQIASALNIPIIIHYPDKSQLDKKSYGQICYARNTLIAKDSDVLMAIVVPERVGGTEHTIREFLKFGKGKDNLILI